MGFKIYKRGQGYYTRLYGNVVVSIIVVCGCYALYQKLTGSNIWVQTFVPAGVCVAFGLLLYWLTNNPKVADFLIAAEGEVKKVSWSSRKEIVTSTLIVICVVIFMAVMLYAADFIFKLLFLEVVKIY